MVKTCIVTGYGINADDELKKAFELAGSDVQKIHINDIIEIPALLDLFHIVGFPGGFSFGDHLGSGTVFGGLFKKKLKNAMDKFIAAGKSVIGICNGFQVLVKMGILPNLVGDWTQEVALIHNDSGKFEDRWVKLRVNPLSPCIWTKGLIEMDVPVRHGEGKFVISDNLVERKIIENNLHAVMYVSKSGGDVQYPDNPNGSMHDIAGICDKTGRVFGLMPHPEAFIFPENHPRWQRERITYAHGLDIFRNGVAYFKEGFKI
ncbi:MAG: phosphoribosylformylglycinamidine synthase subunit PurQ [Spirochaetales bacterium]|nr:phosphoribosylformylglycinamidine synthase subunit PurQ [Spirochaetales bacterium]